MVGEITLTGAALFLLVFLSTIESAYEAMSEISLRVMLSDREDTSSGRFLRELMDHRQRFELMLIFGTQLSIVAIAILLADLITDAQVRQPLAITFVVTVAIVILFRQLVPRALAQNEPQEVLWMLLPLFKVYYRFFSIFVAPMAALLRSMRKPEIEAESREQDDEEAMDEIQALIDVGEEEGIIEESESEMIQSIFELSDTTVEEVMKPRLHIVAIESSATVADARRLMIESKYSRIPVFHDQIDHIEGIIYVRDLLAAYEPNNASMPVTECMRPAYFVPESKSIRELLDEMRKANIQMAMVVDEYGGVAGLVTIEDIIEEIVGEIEDEDRAIKDGEVVKRDDGSYLVDGAAEIRKVEILFDKEIEADDFTTVAGLMISELGHVPAPGEKLLFKGLDFEVVDADTRRINRIKVRPAPTETDPIPAEPENNAGKAKI